MLVKIIAGRIRSHHLVTFWGWKSSWGVNKSPVTIQTLLPTSIQSLKGVVQIHNWSHRPSTATKHEWKVLTIELHGSTLIQLISCPTSTTNSWQTMQSMYISRWWFEDSTSQSVCSACTTVNTSCMSVPLPVLTFWIQSLVISLQELFHTAHSDCREQSVCIDVSWCGPVCLCWDPDNVSHCWYLQFSN